MVSNKILERVKKMLALGNDAAATEAERETALRMAYNLLAKHNLSLSDLPTDENTEVREQQEMTLSADKWARSCANAVAKLFFCKYFFSRTNTSGKDVHYFVGRQSNVETARYMSEYIIRSIKREATKQYKSPTSPQGRSFCVGTVDSIHARVREMMVQAVASSDSTALALVNLHDSEQAANDKWLNNTGVSVRQAKGHTDNSLQAGAYHSGKEYGHTISLAQQVGASAAPSRKQLAG